jgi:hypothetical protein
MRTEDLKTLYLGVILLDITSAMFDELDKEVDLFAMPINLSNMAKIILVFYSHCKPVSYCLLFMFLFDTNQAYL